MDEGLEQYLGLNYPAFRIGLSGHVLAKNIANLPNPRPYFKHVETGQRQNCLIMD